MKIALVYDRVNKFGGAERVLLALHEIWPEAPLYTSVYNPQTAPWAKVFDIKTSFLQNIPFAKTSHEFFPWLTPIAFEQFDFSTFDVVISVSSAEAKNIITTPKTLHICYCLTPTRYLWSGYNLYKEALSRSFLGDIKKTFFSAIAVKLRMVDQITSSRPDKYIAISKTVSLRIKKYYRKDANIIYPPVDTEKFKPEKTQNDYFTRNKLVYFEETSSAYYLLVSRLVPYKKVDLAIKAFNKINKTSLLLRNKKLVIVGSGSEEKYLKSIAAKNIEFRSQNLTDEKLLSYYQNCRALIFPGVEDFGIASLEAQACGRPIIANKEGGVAETVIDGQTGILFNNNLDSLIQAIKKFEKSSFDPIICRKNALKYNKEIFKTKFKKLVEELWKNKA